MWCYQCEQTQDGRGCSRFGACGKDPTVAALQELLIHAAKGIGQFAHRACRLGRCDAEVDLFVTEALFSTVTNVNFDPERLESLVRRAGDVQQRARAIWRQAAPSDATPPHGPAEWVLAETLAGLLEQADAVSLERRRRRLGPAVAGLQELVLYGLKGMAAYADHAQILGKEDAAVWAFFHEALSALADEPTDAQELLRWSLRVGEMNLRVMELLDAAHTEAFGDPVPTRVRVEPLAGKAILVSGHDLKDLEALLQQTEGTGINVYTHGEMLPAHGYPGLHKYPHLAGNYGGAWQDQQREFARFPGAVLMTTNCIQRPAESYEDCLFTSGLVAWPGVRHVTNRDFSPVIRAALAADGFAADGPDAWITVGFGHKTVLGLAGTILDAVRSGAIRRFFLIGGCDGAKSGRNYFTELARAVPSDGVILTLACGKYRFNKLDFGAIGEIPRLLDVGQCNDAYSAIRIALGLADALHTDVNSLPLSLVLSWYEQKAVVILLTLLHLGVRNIRIGPSLPAFIAPEVLDVLVESYGLKPIGEPRKDLAEMLA